MQGIAFTDDDVQSKITINKVEKKEQRWMEQEIHLETVPQVLSALAALSADVFAIFDKP